MASADKKERAGLKWRAEKYADNGAYCLKHKINVGGPLPTRHQSSS